MKSKIGIFLGKFINFFNTYFFQYYGFKLLIKSKQNYKSIFDDRELKYDESGFYYVYPKFSKSELDEYYKNNYLDSFRQDIKYGVIPQDFFHMKMLEDLIPEFKNKIKSVLNFGSGHGGISHILDFTGNYQLLTLDPSKSPLKLPKSQIKHIFEFDELEDNSIDLIYSSHSLEHVSDLEVTINQFKRILKKGGLIFIEVPNADHHEDGPQNNRIDIPHTYYFQQKYFLNNFDIQFINTFNMDRYNVIEWKENIEEKGRVIISLLKFS